MPFASVAGEGAGSDDWLDCWGGMHDVLRQQPIPWDSLDSLATAATNSSSRVHTLKYMVIGAYLRLYKL
jgi:hypothetical protein